MLVYHLRMSNLSDSEKKRLFSLFDNVKQEDRSVGLNRSSNSEVLIVDFMNTFIRAFMASPSLNSNGNHTGGIAGCLKSIGYAAKLINPTKIVFSCFSMFAVQLECWKYKEMSCLNELEQKVLFGLKNTA